MLGWLECLTLELLQHVHLVELTARKTLPLSLTAADTKKIWAKICLQKASDFGNHACLLSVPFILSLIVSAPFSVPPGVVCAHTLSLRLGLTLARQALQANAYQSINDDAPCVLCGVCCTFLPGEH